MDKPFNWKIFWILVAAATFGLIAIIPYSFASQGGPPSQAALPMPLPLLVTIQIASQVLLFGVAIWVGLSFANQIGLGLPILESALRHEPVRDRVNLIVPISIALGVLGALLVVVLDLYLFHPALTAELGSTAAPLTVRPPSTPTWWQGLLASFYGAFDEELLLRLCVMSFLAWLGRFVSKTSEGRPTLAVFWTANVLAAILFGLGHLPATSALVPLTPLVIGRAVVLNGVIGVAAGYLYFTRGLEAAVLSHFSADIILHVLFAI
jgi:Type II CAAX prenyl endopeptidase Rce1-like